MRHFRAFFPPATLPLGMGVAPTSAGLVALSCCAHAVAALCMCAALAVAVAVVTAAAQQHRGVAARAQVTPGRWFHQQMVADGGWAGQGLAFREILTPATSPSRARGTASVGTCNGIGRCRACSELLRQGQFYPTLDCLATTIKVNSGKPAHTPIDDTQITGAARHGVFALALRAPSNTPWRANTNFCRIPLPPDFRLCWQPFTTTKPCEKNPISVNEFT